MVEFIPSDNQEEIKIKFIGRENYINEFNDRRKLIELKERNIYNLYGAGGIGKSSLIEQFQQSVSEVDIKVIALDFKNINSISSFYEKIFEQVGKQAIPTLYFMLAYLAYYKKKNPYLTVDTNKNIFVEESGFLADLMDWSDLITLKDIDAAVPVIGSATKLTIKVFNKIKNKIKLNQKTIKYLEGLKEIEDIENQLKAFLAYDLGLLSEKDTNFGVLFIMDTYEATTNEIKNEVEKFVQSFDATKSMFVIAGREEFGDKEQWGKGFYSNNVNRLNELEVEKILHANTVKEEEIIDAIAQSSKGIPFYLELAIKTYHKQDIKSSKDFKNLTFEKIYERFIKYHQTEETDFEFLSIPRFIHHDIYEELTNKGEREFKRFVSSSLFSIIDKKYYMLDLFQEHIVAGLSKERIVKLNKKMFLYYNDLIDYHVHAGSLAPKEYYFEALYHQVKYLDLDFLKEWFNDIKIVLIKTDQYSLLFDLYKEATELIDLENANELFRFWIESNIYDDSIERMRIGSYLIKYYYSFYSEDSPISVGDNAFNIEDILVDWLEVFGASNLSDYVMKAYLKSPHTYGSTIKKYVKGWIQLHIDDNMSVSHLLADYLKKNDTHIEDVDYLIKRYLAHEEYEENYSYILVPYLQKGGALKDIEEIVIEWINKHKDEKEPFRHFTQTYLSYGGSITPIEASIVYWLDKYKDEKNPFSKLVQTYLNHDGLLTAVESSISYWLDKQKDEKELFSYVVQLYFKKGGSAKDIEASVAYWLEKHKDEKEIFSRIGGAYLQKNGDINLIEDTVKLWLDTNKDLYYRRYLLETAKSVGMVYKFEDCIDTFYIQLYRVNQKKRIRNEQYVEIGKCLMQYSVEVYKDQFIYFFVASQYLKAEDKDIEVAKKLMHRFSQYILKLNNEKKDMHIFEMNELYLTMEDKEDEVVARITGFYEDYLSSIDELDRGKECEYYNVAKIYLGMEKVKEEYVYKIKKILNNLKDINKKCFSSHINILYVLEKFNVFIDAENTEKILKIDSFFLKNYLYNPNAKPEIIEQYFHNLLNNKVVSNKNISTGFIPIIDRYFSEVTKDFQNKNEIICFIKQHIEYRNMSKIILSYLLNDNSLDDIEDSVKLFLKLDGYTGFLNKEIEKKIEDEKYVKLMPLIKLIEVINIAK